MNPVRQVFHSTPAPRPVVCHLVYHKAMPDGRPDFWTVRLYRDNLRTMSGEDQVIIAHWVFDVVQKCSAVHDRVSPEVWETEMEPE